MSDVTLTQTVTLLAKIDHVDVDRAALEKGMGSLERQVQSLVANPSVEASLNFNLDVSKAVAAVKKKTAELTKAMEASQAKLNLVATPKPEKDALAALAERNRVTISRLGTLQKGLLADLQRLGKTVSTGKPMGKATEDAYKAVLSGGDLGAIPPSVRKGVATRLKAQELALAEMAKVRRSLAQGLKGIEKGDGDYVKLLAPGHALDSDWQMKQVKDALATMGKYDSAVNTEMRKKSAARLEGARKTVAALAGDGGKAVSQMTGHFESVKRDVEMVQKAARKAYAAAPTKAAADEMERASTVLGMLASRKAEIKGGSLQTPLEKRRLDLAATQAQLDRVLAGRPVTGLSEAEQKIALGHAKGVATITGAIEKKTGFAGADTAARLQAEQQHVMLQGQLRAAREADHEAGVVRVAGQTAEETRVQARLATGIRRGDIRARAEAMPAQIAAAEAAGRAVNPRDATAVEEYKLAVRKLRHELEQLQKDATKAKVDLASVGKGGLNVDKSVAALNVLSREASSTQGVLHQLRIGMRGFFRYAMVYGAGFAAVGAVSNYLGGLLKFTDSLKELQAIAQATDGDMVGLSASIKGVAANSAFSMDEVVKATTVLAQAGTALKDIPGTLNALVDFATATGATLETAADTITTAKNVFSELSITDVADQLTAAVNVSKLTADNLKAIMSLGAQTAKASGATLQQFLGVSTTLSNQGVRPQTIATGTRQLSLEIFSPDAQTIGFLKRRYAALGENLSEAQIKAQMFAMKNAPNPYIAFLTELKRIGVSGEARDEFRRVIDVRAENALLPLIDNLDKVAEMTAKLGGSGTAAEGAATRVESLTVVFTKLGNSLLALGDQTTKGLQAALTNVVEFFGKVAEAARRGAKAEDPWYIKAGAYAAGAAGKASLSGQTLRIWKAATGTAGGKLDEARIALQEAEAAAAKEREALKPYGGPAVNKGGTPEQLGQAAGAAEKYRRMAAAAFPGREEEARKLLTGMAGGEASKTAGSPYVKGLEGLNRLAPTAEALVKSLQAAATAFAQGQEKFRGWQASENEAVARILARGEEKATPEERGRLADYRAQAGLFQGGVPAAPAELEEKAKAAADYSARRYQAGMAGPVAAKEALASEARRDLMRLEVGRETPEMTKLKATLLAEEGKVTELMDLLAVLREKRMAGLEKEVEPLLRRGGEVGAAAEKKKEAEKAADDAAEAQRKAEVDRLAEAEAKIQAWRTANAEKLYAAERSHLDIEERIKDAMAAYDYEAVAKLIGERAENQKILLEEERKEKENALREEWRKVHPEAPLPEDLSAITSGQRNLMKDTKETEAAYAGYAAVADRKDAIGRDAAREQKVALRTGAEYKASKDVELVGVNLELNKLQLAAAKGRKDIPEIIRLVDEQVAKTAAGAVARRTQDEIAGKKLPALILAEYNDRMEGLKALKEHLLQQNLGVDKLKKVNKLQEGTANAIARLNEAVTSAFQRWQKAADDVAQFKTAVADRKASFEEARAAVKGAGAEAQGPQDAIGAQLGLLGQRQNRGDFAKGMEDAAKIKDAIVSAAQGGGLSEFDASGLLDRAEAASKKAEAHQGAAKETEEAAAARHWQGEQARLGAATAKLEGLKKEAESLSAIQVAFDPPSFAQAKAMLEELTGEKVVTLKAAAGGEAPAGAKAGEEADKAKAAKSEQSPEHEIPDEEELDTGAEPVLHEDGGLSPEGRRVAEYALAKQRAAGDKRLAIIIDKKAQHQASYDAETGKLVSESPVLTGKNKGDKWTTTDTALDKAVAGGGVSGHLPTPSGEHPLNVKMTDAYGKALGFADTQTVTMHATSQKHPEERRGERLASPDALDNAISHGCVNAAQEIIDKVIPAAEERGGGKAYVVPHSQPLEEAFPGLAKFEAKYTAAQGDVSGPPAPGAAETVIAKLPEIIKSAQAEAAPVAQAEAAPVAQAEAAPVAQAAPPAARLDAEGRGRTGRTDREGAAVTPAPVPVADVIASVPATAIITPVPLTALVTAAPAPSAAPPAARLDAEGRGRTGRTDRGGVPYTPSQVAAATPEPAPAVQAPAAVAAAPAPAVAPAVTAAPAVVAAPAVAQVRKPDEIGMPPGLPASAAREVSPQGNASYVSSAGIPAGVVKTANPDGSFTYSNSAPPAPATPAPTPAVAQAGKPDEIGLPKGLPAGIANIGADGKAAYGTPPGALPPGIDASGATPTPSSAQEAAYAKSVGDFFDPERYRPATHARRDSETEIQRFDSGEGGSEAVGRSNPGRANWADRADWGGLARAKLSEAQQRSALSGAQAAAAAQAPAGQAAAADSGDGMVPYNLHVAGAVISGKADKGSVEASSRKLTLGNLATRSPEKDYGKFG